MALNGSDFNADSDFKASLLEAPPSAPSTADTDAAKANATDAAALKLANVTNPPQSLGQPDSSAAKPAVASKPPAPGSFAEHLSNALLDAKKTTDPTALAKPGAWANLMVGATMDALTKTGKPVPTTGPWSEAVSDAGTTRPTTAPLQAPRRSPIAGILDELGDAGAAQGGRGVASGFLRAAGAGRQRTREEMEDRRVMATANAQMLHEQSLIHKQGVDAIDESVKSGQAAAQTLITPVPGAGPDSAGKEDFTGKTSDELEKMIRTGEIDPSVQTVFATGKTLTGKKDANGFPMYRTTYSVVTPAKHVKVTPEIAKLLNENTGSNYPVTDDPNKQQEFPGVQLNKLIQDANNARATKRAFQVGEAKDDEVIRKAQTSKDAESIFQNPVVTNAINGHQSSPDDPFAIVKAYNAIMNDPKLLNDPRTPKNFSEAYIQAAGGPAVWDKKVEEYAKAQQKNADTIDSMLTKAESDPKEIEGHTPAFSAAMRTIINDPKAAPEKKARAQAVLATVQDVRQGEIDLEAAKAAGKKQGEEGFQGDPKAEDGEPFLRSLKPNEQVLVREMGTGKMPITRLEYLAARKPEILEAVARAFPGFDGSKISAYVTAYKDIVSGKTNTELKSGDVALKHLNELSQLNTAASHIPHTPAWTAYQNKVDTVSSELAKFYGDATIPAIAAIKDTLGSTLPGNRLAAISTQSKSMGDKLDTIQDRWEKAAPSAAYEAPLPGISVEAKRARAALDPQYASDHPEFAPHKNRPGQPANTTYMQRPDGKFMFVPDDKVPEAIKLNAKVVQDTGESVNKIKAGLSSVTQ